MRRNMMFALGACLALLLSACSGMPSEANGTGWSAAGERTATADDFAVYAEYGIEYVEAERQLLFNGQRVRYFEDLYPVDGHCQAGMTFFDAEGTVDVKAERDLTKQKRREDGSYDPSGLLVNVLACSQQEFDARDLEPLLHPSTPSAMAGEPASPEELAAHYAVYEPYGLAYDKATDTLSYNGQTVRYFLDVLSSNGQALNSGKFQGIISNHWTDSGVIDVKAQRDYGQDGSGVLTGLAVYTPEEFAARTESERKTESGGVATFYEENKNTQATEVQDEN